MPRRLADDYLAGIAMGDFNHVPWSHTLLIFKRAGGLLDPRAGRGSYANYPAQIAPIGWPLDQLFVTQRFELRGLRVLGTVGSDHRPLIADLCFASALLSSHQDTR